MKIRSHLAASLLIITLLLAGGSAYPQSAGFHASEIGSNGVLVVCVNDTFYDGSDGTLFGKVPLPRGATALQFRVTGGVETDGTGRVCSADGLTADGTALYDFTATHWAGTYHGTRVGSTTGTDPGLFGVFFNPAYGGTPANSDNFRSDSGIVPDPRRRSVYSPPVNGPFWIGDGYNNNNWFITAGDALVPSGSIQTFTVPTGAVYLLLGIGADDCMADNVNGPNSVGFRVHVFDDSPLTNTAPEICEQPAGKTVYVGMAVRLDVIARGASPMAFQWRKDTTPLHGQTNASLALANVALVDTGDYTVVITNAFGSVTSGVARVTVVVPPTHYVSLESTNPVSPYTNWLTAARDIQAAVNAAATNELVLVTNGVYAGGVSINTPLTIASVNGPQFTIIDGGRDHCILVGARASMNGFTLTNGYGGVWGDSTAVLTKCVITGNIGGAGANGCTLYGCTLSGNQGPGADSCTLYNCRLTGNSGSGAVGCTLYNCTLTGNSAESGGGATRSALYNCIVYFNTAAFSGANYDSCTLNYCCTTPLPTDGVGNICVDPELASASHLSADSPCIGAGSATYATGTDIDGEPWGIPPSIGCNEFHPGSRTGGLTVSEVADYTNVAVGFPVTFTAFIEGRPTHSMWDFGDGNLAINEPYITHTWARPGDYLVALRVYNESNPQGVNATLMVHTVAKSVLYVAATSMDPQPPYAGWATAATNIQDALNVAVPGAEIVVSNGVYAAGVAANVPVKLLSVNGPQVTVIDGGDWSGCVSLTDGASLTGFTVANCYGGGVRCSSANVFLTNCVIVGNGNAWFRRYGGGAYGGTLYNCTLTGNSAGSGGGAFGSTLYNCTLTGNSAAGYWSWNGMFSQYVPGDGGATYRSTLYNCALASNSSADYGGAAASSTLYNCALTSNSSTHYGGAADSSALYNCTLAGNSAEWGGGASGCTLYNCIACFNTAPDEANYDTSSILNYCCTTPLPTNGVGNIALDPQLATASHLSASSPCRGAGSAAYATESDIDGEPWLNPPSIGCDEYQAGSLTGPITVNLAANHTTVAVGYTVSFTALIEGPVSDSAWDFGDGGLVSNRPFASHAWTAPGDYLVVLRAHNESQPGGVSATLTIHVLAGVMYVTPSSTNPQPPYTNWDTAARNIQQAVDAASAGVLPGVSLVVVSNGVYAGGVTVNGPFTLQTVNGPQCTVIKARGTNECISLSGGASLVGFTLTNGSGGVYSDSSGVVSNCLITGNSCGASGATLYNCTLAGNSGWGGGASCCRLYNCTLTANNTSYWDYGGGASGSTLYNCTLSGNSAMSGGGASGCTLYNCTLTGNSAEYYGGGAKNSTLYNCTLTGNSAAQSGGACGCTLYNSIVYFNTAPLEANYDFYSTFTNCCTTPLPTNGVGNIAADPQLASASHLSADSPCRAAGSAAYAAGTDIDGEPWGNPPSIGCDEYYAGAVTGPLTVSFVADYTNVTAEYPVRLTARITGQATDSVWDFGDGELALNEPCVTHAWTQPGDYLVGLWAFNETHQGGVSAHMRIHVVTAHPVYYVAAASANPQPPYATWATAARDIQDALTAAAQGPGLVLVTNGVYRGRAVTKPLTLRSVNGPPFTTITGLGTRTCVSLAEGASLTGFTLRNGYAPYTGGGVAGVYCASTNVCLTNCVITANRAEGGVGGAYGGTLYNCLLSGNSAVNASGGGASSCTLYNCTLVGNSAAYGGGADYCTLYNCTLTRNSGYYSGAASGCVLYNCTLTTNSASWGGGAGNSTLYNCTLSGNLAKRGQGGDETEGSGGGADYCTLYNCTLTGNSAQVYGGGAISSTLYNCIAYFNTAPTAPNCDPNDNTLNYCCTTPLPAHGVGNISADPIFINLSQRNLRLQSNSRCVNTGNNSYLTSSNFTNCFDLDGRPRIVGGRVDMGAYECQPAISGAFIAWLGQYSLPTDGSADLIDSDTDGHSNWQEWVCGTCPTNEVSALCLLSATPNGTDVTVTWQSATGVNYFLERSANLSAQSCFACVATNIIGQAGTTTYADTNATGPGPFFYRVGVNCP